MATKPNFSGRKLLIRIGNGASPEVFSVKCSFNGDRAISFSAASTDEMDIDCDDPTAVAWTITMVDSLSAELTGAGQVKSDEVPFFFDWFSSGEPKNVEVDIDDGAYEVSGAVVLLGFTINGGETGSATADMSMKFTGPVLGA